MVVREYGYVKGNTAVKPQRKGPERQRTREEDLKRKERIRKRKQFENEKRIRKSVFQIAIAIFVIGMVILGRDAKVYNMQKDLTQLESEIKSVQDENEALRINLLKVASLDNIRTYAESKLGMSIATRENSMQIEAPENYFNDAENGEAEEEINKDTLFSKIMDALTN